MKIERQTTNGFCLICISYIRNEFYVSRHTLVFWIFNLGLAVRW